MAVVQARLIQECRLDQELNYLSKGARFKLAFQDKALVCRDCGQEFVFTAGEQQFYVDHGFQSSPPGADCRRAPGQSGSWRRPPCTRLSARPAARPAPCRSFAATGRFTAASALRPTEAHADSLACRLAASDVAAEPIEHEDPADWRGFSIYLYPRDRQRLATTHRRVASRRQRPTHGPFTREVLRRCLGPDAGAERGSRRRYWVSCAHSLARFTATSAAFSIH